MYTWDIAAIHLENITCQTHVIRIVTIQFVIKNGTIFRLNCGIINNYIKITDKNLDCTGHTVTYSHPGNSLAKLKN